MTINNTIKPMKGDNPSWFLENTIHHELDSDLTRRAGKKNDGKYENIFIFDTDFDQKRNQLHLQWSDEDIVQLWEGILGQSISILRYAKEDSVDFQEAIEFINSDLCEVVCKALNLDVLIIRTGVQAALKNYGKNVDANRNVITKETDNDRINTMFSFQNTNALTLEH